MQRLRLARGIGRHQPVALAGQVQQPGAAFEDLQVSVVQERNLAERLALEMVGLAAIERDRPDGVVETGLLAGPSQPQITHKTAGALRHPIQGPDDQLAHRGEPSDRGTGDLAPDVVARTQQPKKKSPAPCGAGLSDSEDLRSG